MSRPSMTPAMMEAVQERRRIVHELMPEAIPFIESLVREGLLTGWRNVVWAGTAAAGEARNAVQFAPRTLTYRQFMDLGKKENQKWTTSRN